MRRAAFLAACLLLLAGCSDPNASADAEDVDFGVKATETTGVIRGVVYDDAIRPLAGVNVTIAALGNRTVATGEAGEFGFQDLAPGTYFLQATRHGYAAVQASAEVVAGESEPPITKIRLVAIPTAQPYVDALTFSGYLSFGVAVGLTSVGTTVYEDLANALGDRSIWTVSFTQLPTWVQGELVWDQTQPAGGEFIWEMTDTSNAPAGYRETTASPALAYWNTTVIEEHRNSTLDPERGIAYRFFGGPHPTLKPECVEDPVFGINPCYFGYGVTLQQKADAYVHNFYHFAPPEGWRFTVDGPPVVPAA